ncbi:type I DNA topoisomerase [Microbaculum sp. FT89]|uniref:type I DNA topoisomerase n=1 Tax=Microbaculum sp. FT89 TaxID=3447298 RepID=UPI003F52EE8C
MQVVIVESPAKAKTINKYLGGDYHVLASFGHIRDLPSKDGSVQPDQDFEMTWEIDPKKSKQVSEIASAVKTADRVILATDPDREGEAISWHVLEVLRRRGVLKDKPVDRVVFNAVTKQAVLDAIAHPREIDGPLVEAYLARRALDYLVGFTLSPVLWRKIPGARSAGRVQSVALRIVSDREAEIESFVPREYWSIVAGLNSQGNAFDARLVTADGKKIDRLTIGAGAEAEALKAALEQSGYAVRSVEKKPVKRHPYAPFTTSTLQQEASRKLGFSADRTMRTAQRLYEGINLGGETVGLITYMRTDGVEIVPEAINAARGVIATDYGDRYLPSSPRVYKTKAKNAQEAHEAIRPTDLNRRPAEVRRALDEDQARLYELIWKRTLASQMESAELERTTVDIEATAPDGKRYGLRAVGTVQRFDGFLTLYQETADDDSENEEDRRLPALKDSESLGLDKVTATQHFTEPPPRFTEATLIKRLEELGIGRPSTYAATLKVLEDREYVRLDKRRLIPEPKGRIVTAFLEGFFKRYVEYDFTASLEEKLDRISNGEIGWRDVLREFWRDFATEIEATSELKTSEVFEALNNILGPYVFPPKEDGSDARACPSCEGGRLSIKRGKNGPFIGCSNYPECRYTRDLTTPGDGDAAEALVNGQRVLGTDPETNQEVSLRTGRFGPYVQLGEAPEGEKPKRASLPKGVDAASVDLERALSYLSLPREVGIHPETSKPITAGIGRYGPFVQHDGIYANLESAEEVFTVGLNRAVTLIAEKQQRGGRRGAAATIKALGDNADFGTIEVKAGRYGPYVTNGKINATLPKGTEPEGVTMELAAELLAAKAEKGGGKKPKRAKKKASPKS